VKSVGKECAEPFNGSQMFIFLYDNVNTYAVLLKIQHRKI
jgi:hypothetical protein